MKQIIAVAALSIYFFSCNQEESTIMPFGKCSGAILTDSLSIRTKLIGSWNWTQRYCPCCRPDSKPTLADKVVKATFRTDSTFSVSEDSKIITTGTWELQKNGTGFFISIMKQGTGNYLDGSITLCDSQLLADMSPVDGCEHLFIKAH